MSEGKGSSRNGDESSNNDTSQNFRGPTTVIGLVFFITGLVFSGTLMEMKNTSFFTSNGAKQIKQYENPVDTLRNASVNLVVVAESRNNNKNAHRNEILPWVFSHSKPQLPQPPQPQHGNKSTTSRVYRTRAQVPMEFNSTIQFIFTMGLEGTFVALYHPIS